MNLDNLWLSVGNLHRMFGRTDDELLGIVINGGLALTGVLLWWALAAPWSYVGLIWAIINLLGIAKWVIEG